jgi:hypothetical protein
MIAKDSVGSLSGSPKFDAVLRRAGFIWDIGFMLESAARVVGTFTLPVETMVWLSTVLFPGSFAVIMVVAGATSATAGQMVAAEAQTERCSSPLDLRKPKVYRFVHVQQTGTAGRRPQRPDPLRAPRPR